MIPGLAGLTTIWQTRTLITWVCSQCIVRCSDQSHTLLSFTDSDLPQGVGKRQFHCMQSFTQDTIFRVPCTQDSTNLPALQVTASQMAAMQLTEVLALQGNSFLSCKVKLNPLVTIMMLIYLFHYHCPKTIMHVHHLLQTSLQQSCNTPELVYWTKQCGFELCPGT